VLLCLIIGTPSPSTASLDFRGKFSGITGVNHKVNGRVNAVVNHRTQQDEKCNRPPILERPSIDPNLRFAIGYFIQQIWRNVWVIKFKANLVSGRDCPNPDLNSPSTIWE